MHTWVSWRRYGGTLWWHVSFENVEACLKPKEPSVGNPDLYLETKMSRAQLDSSGWAWFTRLSKCAQEAVRVCRQLLKDNFDKIYETIFSNVYCFYEMDGGARWSWHCKCWFPVVMLPLHPAPGLFGQRAGHNDLLKSQAQCTILLEYDVCLSVLWSPRYLIGARASRQNHTQTTDRRAHIDTQ